MLNIMYMDLYSIISFSIQFHYFSIQLLSESNQEYILYKVCPIATSLLHHHFRLNNQAIPGIYHLIISEFPTKQSSHSGHISFHHFQLNNQPTAAYIISSFPTQQSSHSGHISFHHFQLNKPSHSGHISSIMFDSTTKPLRAYIDSSCSTQQPSHYGHISSHHFRLNYHTTPGNKHIIFNSITMSMPLRTINNTLFSTNYHANVTPGNKHNHFHTCHATLNYHHIDKTYAYNKLACKDLSITSKT